MNVKGIRTGELSAGEPYGGRRCSPQFPSALLPMEFLGRHGSSRVPAEFAARTAGRSAACTRPVILGFKTDEHARRSSMTRNYNLLVGRLVEVFRELILHSRQECSLHVLYSISSATRPSRSSQECQGSRPRRRPRHRTRDNRRPAIGTRDDPIPVDA